MNIMEYRFADKQEQVKKINKNLMVVYTIFALFFTWIMVVSRWFEQRPLPIVISFVAACVVTLVIDWSVYLKDKRSEIFKFIVFVGLSIIVIWAGLVFDAAYLKFFTITPLILCIFYFDNAFTMITCVMMMIFYQGLTIVKCFVIKSVPNSEMVEEFCTSAVIIFILALIIIAEKAGKRFNEDALGKVKAEKEMQEKMMYEMLFVASNVRSGTQEVMGVVNRLSDSANNVTSAMKDISKSTQGTAESIETQTTMTQSIQDAIDQTIQYSRYVVAIAEESKKLNFGNVEMMKELKDKSVHISEQNQNAAKMMQELLEQSIAVKGISDAIFSISSQTNLLALNASIESARVGEAGRGFAVVSDEIRQLAEKTRSETESIARVLEALSENAQSAYDTVTLSAKAVNEEDELIGLVSKSFDEMNVGVNELIENIGQIDDMLLHLSEANNQIVDNIMLLSATTEQVSASTTEVEILSGQNLTDADEARKMLEGVITVSDKLDQFISIENE